MSDDSNDGNTGAVLTSAGLVPLPKDTARDAIAAHINDMLLAAHRKAGPFHPESILTEIGALAGFSAQMALRKGIIEPQNLDPRQILVGAATKSGETFYFSDAMNWILFERMDDPPYSIWSYVAGVVGDTSRPCPTLSKSCAMQRAWSARGNSGCRASRVATCRTGWLD